MLTGKASLLLCLPFQQGSTLKGKNLLLKEQIFSIKSRPHVKELHHPMKQTGINVLILYYFGKEAGAY